MAGLCFYNLTIGYRFKRPDITNNGQNRVKGSIGDIFDIFYDYKNKR